MLGVCGWQEVLFEWVWEIYLCPGSYKLEKYLFMKGFYFTIFYKTYPY